MQVIAAIPARWASSRLPGKPLRLLAGRPMIEHVWRRVQKAKGIQRVVVLTDHPDIAQAVESFGGEYCLTPEDCASGTDRIAWAARDWDAEVIINVQGDEPLIEPRVVEELAALFRVEPEVEMATFAAEALPEEVADPNAVKVVLDQKGYALYFSRSTIPYRRNESSIPVRRHLGIYAYRKSTLLRLASLSPSALEKTESLEQLRALESGIPIRVLETDHRSPGVDTEADLRRVEEMLRFDDPLSH